MYLSAKVQGLNRSLNEKLACPEIRRARQLKTEFRQVMSETEKIFKTPRAVKGH